MNTETSQLIRSLRLIMVIGLVFVHFGNFPGDPLDPFTGVVNAEFVVASSINSFFTYFFLCSVPILSMISGYLFCYQGKPNFIETLKKKNTTLILPYLTWTTIWLLFAFVLYSIGKSSNQFTYYDQGFSDYNILDLLNGIIGITETPFAFQFWFVHDLVLSIIITPIIIPAIKKFGAIVVIIPFLLWAMDYSPWIFFNFKVIAFFNFGLYIGIKKVNINIPTNLKWLNLSIILFIIMVLVRIYTPAAYNGKMPFENIYELFLRIIGSLAIITLAINMKIYLNGVFKYLVNHSGYAFFLHAFHFPIIILMKQILFMTGIFQGELGLIFLWITSIVVTILTAIITAEVIHRYLPGLYRYLNGQRSI